MTPYYPCPCSASFGIAFADKPMRSIFLMKEPLCFGEGGRRNVSISPHVCALYRSSIIYVISPRIVVSDAGLVFFQIRAVGERRD